MSKLMITNSSITILDVEHDDLIFIRDDSPNTLSKRAPPVMAWPGSGSAVMGAMSVIASNHGASTREITADAFGGVLTDELRQIMEAGALGMMASDRPGLSTSGSSALCHQ
ncbi:hypothetical protein EHZ86_16825 [Aeromonas australiensis]|uniref:hypothetical protein n=1 Tax=Aeromonas australiensis TaxID=1114880 RepID=UPI001F17B77D|nr:hypothetical protein [Aeromonas australiensis]MCF3098900.1 hypothetical protein [Aeromonas australiensis]